MNSSGAVALFLDCCNHHERERSQFSQRWERRLTGFLPAQQGADNRCHCTLKHWCCSSANDQKRSQCSNFSCCTFFWQTAHVRTTGFRVTLYNYKKVKMNILGVKLQTLTSLISPCVQLYHRLLYWLMQEIPLACRPVLFLHAHLVPGPPSVDPHSHFLSLTEDLFPPRGGGIDMVSFLRAMGEACDDITAERYQAWIQHARRF